MKKLLILATILFIPLTAQARIIEFFFPTLRDTSDDPSRTLVAPFAEPSETPAEPIRDFRDIKLPENAIPLERPHRLSADMTDWVATSAIEALNFLGDDHTQDMTKIEPLFDAPGYRQYTDFLRENRIMRVLESGQFKVRSYNENTPLLLNEGAVDGRYRWLFRVPVIISYLDANADGYENATATNQRATLDIQIGRTADTQNREGVVMERWSGTVTAFEAAE